MNTKKLVASYPVLASSANPEELSLTVKGALIGLIPILIFILGQSGYIITDNELVEIINNFFIIISNAMMIYGALRKIYYSRK